MVQISLQNSSGKVMAFLGGSMDPPLGHQREWKYLGHVSGKLTILEEEYAGVEIRKKKKKWRAIYALVWKS